MQCDTCHWLKDPEHWVTKRTDGRMVENHCQNLGEPCWHYWEEHQTAPENCESYCKKGEYVPTGIWAQIAKVVEAVANKIGEDK